MPLFARPLREKIHVVRAVRAQPGPLTAREAFALALPHALDLDRQARLTLVTSGTDLNLEGRSFTWDFCFHLPARDAVAVLGVRPCRRTDEVDEDALCLDLQARPALPPLRPSFAAGVARSLGLTPGQLEARRRASAEERLHRALPLPFRDSPEAVAALAAQGADFVTGPTDIALSSAVLASGDAVWQTHVWDAVYSTPFAAAPEDER